MKDTFGGTFAAYYDGDPLVAIPVMNLPCLIVEQTGDETVEGAFGQHDVTDPFTVKVVMNKSDDWDGSAKGVNPLNLTAKKIHDLVGLVDEKTGTYAVNTVKHALRAHLTNGETALAPEMTVEYGVSPRSVGRVTRT